MIQTFRERPFVALAWSVNLLVLPLLAFLGRNLLNFFQPMLGDRGLGWILAGVILLVLIAAGFLLVRKSGPVALIHLSWMVLLFLGIMYFTERNPERWLHIPLFASLGYLSVTLYSVRTGTEVALGYAFGDELIQYFLPDRNGSVEDVMINAVCAGIGVLMFVITKRES